jgi:hypothetical protein
VLSWWRVADNSGGFVSEAERRGRGLTPSTLAIAVLFIVATVGWMLRKDIVLARQSRASAGWPTTSGEVASSRVAHRSGGRHSSPCDWPQVCFHYALGGQSFTGCRATFSQSCDRTSAQELAARYPVGARVEISYDPDNPAAAVLEPNSWDDQLNLAAGGLFIGLLLAYLAVSIFRSRRVRPR